MSSKATKSFIIFNKRSHVGRKKPLVFSGNTDSLYREAISEKIYQVSKNYLISDYMWCN